MISDKQIKRHYIRLSSIHYFHVMKRAPGNEHNSEKDYLSHDKSRKINTLRRTYNIYYNINNIQHGPHRA